MQGNAPLRAEHVEQVVCVCFVRQTTRDSLQLAELVIGGGARFVDVDVS